MISSGVRFRVAGLGLLNTDARQWSSNHPVQPDPPATQRLLLRLQRPARHQSGALVDRALIAKVTYLMAF
jgi:hypothetical protein